VGVEPDDGSAIQVIKTHVLREVIDFVEDHRGTEEPVLMPTLTTLYNKRIAALGFEQIKCNTARLQEDVERSIPDIKAVKTNQVWSLVFDDDLSTLVRESQHNTSADDVLVILKAAKLLRAEYLPLKREFTGSFSDVCKIEAIPPMMRSFLQMLLDGSGLDQLPPEAKKAKVVASIGQQIIYNSVKRRSSKASSALRHGREKEMPSCSALHSNEAATADQVKYQQCISD
jgi:hypothetical protein